MNRFFGACLFGTALFGMSATAVDAACIAISKPADLNKIRTSLAGQFCLTQDIDMSAVASFVPIGDVAHPYTNPFRGLLDGQGHVIRNLKITTGLESGGLFITFGRAGVIRNLGLVNVKVAGTSASPRIGALVGEMLGPLPGDPPNVEKVIRVYVTGSVRANDSALIGGLVGNKDGGSIVQSYSKAAVTAGRYNSIGGLVGVQSFGGISESYATGPVTADDSGNVGGLVGNNQNDQSFVERSYATGPVTEKGGSGTAYVGGLIGKNDAPVRDSFATGAVQASDYDQAGGLVGNNSAEGALARVFAAGRVRAGAGSSTGGLIGFNVAPPGPAKRRAAAITAAFWDTETSGLTVGAVGTSAGTGRTTAQLQAALPAGFSSAVWGISPGVSYPYLKAAGLNFRPTLATTVFNARLYTFLPIGQRDPFEYSHAVVHSDQASKAAAFTILARAIGVTRAVATLSGVKIDTYFWNDAARTSTWRGPVTSYAALGAFTPIPAAQAIGANVIGPLRSDRLVILRGGYVKAGGGAAQHWLLATSSVGTRIFADDPWTGLQVQVDTTSKTVVAPAGFPLAQFKVNGFIVVTLK